ncbi:uncharacterized protein JCM15063_003461 [Sporobolomyces koalae]|uniref:uncharacterized protein n=1 Tax=Sporobolomyces koalae TaxID=500713 RepID=UPI00317FA947
MGREIRLMSPVLGRSPVASSTRRGCSSPRRLVPLLAITLLALLSFDALFFHTLIGTAPVDPLAIEQQEQVDQELIKVLTRTKEAMEARTPVADLAGFADRIMVLSALDSFRSELNTTYSHLNASTQALYTRSLEHHHSTLFDLLFPYIRKSRSIPRSFAQLRSLFTVPRGIVIPCGNDQFVYAVHLVATLKHVHRTKLPIHIVYAGGDDLFPEKRAALRSIHPDVETVDMLNFFDEDLVGIHGGGWAVKAFAALASPFQEVIIADADAIFMQDPANMYHDPGYESTGTLFFRDREIFPGEGQVHEWWHSVMKGRQPSEQMAKSRWWSEQASREEMESGVIVFDKRRREVALGLVFAGYLNTKGVREPVTYANTYGDKESFWMAFELAGIPYHMDQEYAAIIGQLTHPDTKSHSIDSFIQSDHLFHLDHKGRPLWWNGSLFMEKRVKDRGYLIATHWAPGSVDWVCDTEPWSMRTTQRDVVDLQHDLEFTSTLSEMIGAAVWWEGRFPRLLEQHYASDWGNKRR